jgi:hypothetical protein
MSVNTPVLITGCQRSGTTLLYLILDSHPQIRGMDEWEFKTALFDIYLTQPEYHPCFAVKLPKIAHFAPALAAIPGAKVLWCVRDPRDVVTSMLKLGQTAKSGLKTKALWSLRHPGKVALSILKRQTWPISISWAASSQGASQEIAQNAATLKSRKVFPEELSLHWDRYKQIKRKHPLHRNRDDQVFLSALCWRVKQEVFGRCCQESEICHVVQYEKLIQQPEIEIQVVLRVLNLPWHENVLKHHTLHSGIVTGKTDSERPIDGRNTDKWKGVLSDQDVITIARVCGDAAKDLYHLESDE